MTEPIHGVEQDGGAEPTVQVDFTLGIGPGQMDASVVVPSGQVTLTQILPALHSLCSNIMGSTVAQVEAEGYKVSCRAGCGACCRQMVPLSIFEAEKLADWVRTLPQERQEELARRFDAALIALRDGGMLERMHPQMWAEGNEESTTELALDYLKLRVACPFLEEESCSIHPIRPLICREYLVTSPAEFCFEPTREKVKVVPVPVKLSTVVFRLGAEVEGGGRGWIPLVFLFVWMRAKARPGDAVQGAGPEVLYEVVRRLAVGNPENKVG